MASPSDLPACHWSISSLCRPSTVEIGWRLGTDFWGLGYATEAARELLRLGFEDRGLDEIVSFAVPQNTRSIAVMDRLGLRPDPSRDFDHPRVPDSHPHLRRHVLYALERTDLAAAIRLTSNRSATLARCGQRIGTVMKRSSPEALEIISRALRRPSSFSFLIRSLTSSGVKTTS